MKAISLTQPWADLVVRGLKVFETRSWQTSHTGLLLIHASKKFPGDCKALVDEEPYRWLLKCDSGDLVTGAIIGAIDLKKCWSTQGMVVGSVERQVGDFGPDRYAWELENARRFQPIECKGHLGVWNTLAEIEQQILEQL